MTEAPTDFVQSFYANVLATDLAAISPTDRERMAASIWELAQDRKPGQIKLRLYNPSPVDDGWTVDHTVLEIVNDDMPFAGIYRGFAAPRLYRAYDYPSGYSRVVAMRRATCRTLSQDGAGKAGHDAKSMMHIQFDHCLDPALLKEMKDEMPVVL